MSAKKLKKPKKKIADVIVSPEQIEQSIHTIRGLKVMLDSELADLYGVETRILNQAVKRNQKRFPKDFMFQLTKEEKKTGDHKL